MICDPQQSFNPDSRRTPSRKVRKFAIIDILPHQPTSRPQTLICFVELLRIEISESEIAPVMQAWSVFTLSCRRVRPIRWLKRLGNLGS